MLHNQASSQPLEEIRVATNGKQRSSTDFYTFWDNCHKKSVLFEIVFERFSEPRLTWSVVTGATVTEKQTASRCGSGWKLRSDVWFVTETKRLRVFSSFLLSTSAMTASYITLTIAMATQQKFAMRYSSFFSSLCPLLRPLTCMLFLEKRQQASSIVCFMLSTNSRCGVFFYYYLFYFFFSWQIQGNSVVFKTACQVWDLTAVRSP